MKKSGKHLSGYHFNICMSQWSKNRFKLESLSGKLKLRKLNFAGYRLLHSLDRVPYSWHQPCILLVYDLPFAFVFIKQGNMSHRTLHSF